MKPSNILVLAASLMTLACGNTFTGTLDVNETFTIKSGAASSDSSPWPTPSSSKTIVVDPGTYEASLTLTKNSFINLTIKEGLNRTRAKIKIPEGSYPRGSGSVDIPASQTGQSFGLKGIVDVDKASDGPYRDWEWCALGGTEEVCERDDDGEVRCRNQPRSGRRDVEYYDVDQTTNVSLDLVSKVGNRKIAKYTGTSSSEYRSYVRQGSCEE